jgi:serine/threonine-protein kinase
VARDGTLVYVPAGAQTGARRSLVWSDRRGREQPLAAPPRAYLYPRLSPDGKRIAVAAADQEHDIWIWDVSQERLTRFTFGDGFDLYPVWTPDGQRLVWGRGGGKAARANLYWQPADGTDVAHRFTDDGPGTEYVSYPLAITPDGTQLVVREDRPKTGLDLAMLTFDSKPQVTPLIRTPYSERNAEISPNGHWLAYESDESGREEIWVRPFPDVNAGRWQVSTGGGRQPLWARNGQWSFKAEPTSFITRACWAAPMMSPLTGSDF